ncbi:aspartate/glutamate racemase family protein [Patescibacteria group bacterium]|nr:aspartate/glutamate racemase family protein [Patescibacteria group bacterium]
MKTRVIVSAVIEDGDNLLFAKKKENVGPYPNTWHLIGGGIEEEELLEESIKREVREEANTDVEIIEKVGFDDDFEPDKKGELTHYIFLTTIQNKLYETAFEKEGIIYVTPNDLEQAKIGKCILNLETGKQKNSDREERIKIINNFEKKNVDCVALACTDLQLLIPKHPRVPIFDTIKLFADATVEKIMK